MLNFFIGLTIGGVVGWFIAVVMIIGKGKIND